MSLAKDEMVMVGLNPGKLKESTEGKSSVTVEWTTGPWAGNQQKVDVSEIVQDGGRRSSTRNRPSREQEQEQRGSTQKKKRVANKDDDDEDEEWVEDGASGSPKKKAKTDKKAAKSESSNESEKKTIKSKSKSTPSKPNVRYTFDERLEQCKDFKDEHGHCKIPTTYKNSNNKNLGVWVQEMRRNYKAQMQGLKPRQVIPDDRIQALNAIEFHWGYEAPPDAPQSDEMWTKCFEQIKEYHAEHKSFDIPLGSDHDFLAKWVRVQRSQMKKRQSKVKCHINKDRIKLLDGIKFNWSGNRDIKFGNTATKKSSAAAAAGAAATNASKKASKSSPRTAPSSSSSSSAKKKTETKKSKPGDSNEKKARTKNGKKTAKKTKNKDKIVDEEEFLPDPVPLKDINADHDGDDSDIGEFEV